MILQEEKEEQAYTKSEDTGKLAFFCAALAVSLTQHTHPTLTSAFTRLAQQDEATVMGGLDLAGLVVDMAGRAADAGSLCR